MYQLLTPFNVLNEFNRGFGRFYNERPLDRQETDVTDWVPQVDIKENDSGYSVLADIPGINPSDVEITLHNNVLTIRGERNEVSESNEFRHRERTYGSFVRQFNLPDSVDENGVKAQANNGVIEISVPRIPEARPRAITVEGI